MQRSAVCGEKGRKEIWVWGRGKCRTTIVVFHFVTGLLNWKPSYLGGCTTFPTEGVCAFCSRQTQTQVLFSFHSLPFWVKEEADRLKNEIREVKELDNWQPASPLMHNLLLPGGLKNFQRIV